MMEENMNQEPMAEESMGGTEEVASPESQAEETQPQQEQVEVGTEEEKSGIIGFIKGLFQ